jgi:methylated-DNA-[protein]-cysteine S-methyltransferase
MVWEALTNTLSLDRIGSPVGRILLAHDAEGRLRALDFEDCEARMRRLLRLHYGHQDADFVLREATAPISSRHALERYFGGELRAIDDVPVATAGTDFQREVWAALRTIAPGTTVSYATLAQKLGRSKSVRAVGLANGANPIGIVVPCHRVIGSDSSLTGYGGGLDRKRWLLAHEGIRFRSDRYVA